MLTGLYEAAREAYGREGRLFDVHLDLLYQCDLDCEHCYLDDKAREILPTGFWRGVIDQVADLEVFNLVLSGGELFLRKDVMELIAHARSRGLFVHLKTHAGRLDADDAARLAELGVSTVVVSYYSTRPEIHDAITRRPGSHARTLAAMRELAARGVRVVAVCIVMDRNRDDYRAVVAQGGEVGFTVRLNGTLRVAQSGADFPRQTALDREALVELEAFRAAYSNQSPHCDVDAPANDWGARKLCAAGHLSLYVDPGGQVMPCISWPEPLGDLTRGDRLADLWQGSSVLARVRGYRQRDRAHCGDCGGREHCGYCPGQAYLENSDPMAAADSLCETTWAGRRAAARAAGAAEPPMPPGLRRARFRVLSPAEVARARAAGAP
jgi:radical SAM protein with 4Fe4S-binding SPASM domain